MKIKSSIIALALFAIPVAANAQTNPVSGAVGGAAQGSYEGSRAAGPVGSVVGGALGAGLGAVTGTVNGVVGTTDRAVEPVVVTPPPDRGYFDSKGVYHPQ
jgi:hypothetical protein